MIIFICSICLNNVWARETGTMDQLEKENPDDVDKMNKVLYYYNTLFFENYTEEELKQQEKFQKSIHLLNELYQSKAEINKLAKAIRKRKGPVKK